MCYDNRTIVAHALSGFTDVGSYDASHQVDVLDLHAALDALREVDPRWSKIVEMRYFAGATEDDVAAHLHLSRKTISRDWQLARAWLLRRLSV